MTTIMKEGRDQYKSEERGGRRVLQNLWTTDHGPGHGDCRRHYYLILKVAMSLVAT